MASAFDRGRRGRRKSVGLPKSSRRHRTAIGRHMLRLELLEPRQLLNGAADQQTIQLFSTSPTLFVQNQGQVAEPAVRYAFYGSGANVLLTDRGPTFQLFQHGAAATPAAGGDLPVPARPQDRLAQPRQAATGAAQFSAQFVGANVVAPVGIDRAETVYNYFVGDSSQWRAQVPTFQQVAYQGLYRGVDLVASGRRDSLKYEFHVAPGADYRQIEVRYEGIEGLSLDPNGALRIKTSLGDLTDDAPLAYQTINGQQVPVAGRFQLVDANSYTFAVTGAYDHNVELVIDPNLDWSTYLGGEGGTYSEWGSGVAIDTAGDAFVIGTTDSGSFPAANNSFRGYIDVFVAKVTNTGSLAWATYLGGDFYDWGGGIVLDAQGNVYVTGSTSASDLAGANDSYHGGYDAFVAKISAGGSLDWASYLGGTGDDTSSGIALDSAGNLLVTGSTNSSDFAGAGNAYHGGSYDAFVSKITGSGSLLWTSYLGGTGWDEGWGVAADSADNPLVTGSTSSSDFEGANNSHPDSGSAAFAAKITGSGSLLWATYLGQAWQGLGIAVDGADNALVTGSASTQHAVPGSTSPSPDTDAFVAKITSGGSLVWFTNVGGSGEDIGRGIALDSLGNAFVTGYTDSADLEAALNAASGNLNYLNHDAFLARVASGGGLGWAMYLGGSGDEQSFAIAMDGAANALVTGYTTSWDLPTANNTLQGSYDGFVAKLGGADVPMAPRVLLNAQRFVNSGTLTVTVSAIDNGGGLPDGTAAVLDVDLNNDGNFSDSGEQGYTTATLSGGAVTFDVAPALADGIYTLRARVSDQLGLEGSSASGQVFVDTTPPSVNLTVPSYITYQTLSATLNVSDATSGIASPSMVLLDVDLNGDGDFADPGETGRATAQVWGTDAAFPLSPMLGDGTYTVRVRLSDRAGNEGISNVATVTVDTTAPSVTLTAPAFTKSTPFVVTASVSDTGSGVADGAPITLYIVRYYYGYYDYVDILDGTLSGGSATFHVTSNLYDGAYGLQARVTDRAGNQGYSDPVPVLVDATAPWVVLNAPGLTNSTTPAITVTAYDSNPSDPYGGNTLPDGTAVTLDVDLNNDGNFSDAGEVAYATTSSFLGGSATFNAAPALAQGTYGFRARVSDQAGNEGTSDVAAVVVDTTPPTAAMSARDSILLGTGDPQDITVTYADNIAVKLKTLFGGGILVTGPHGFSQSAELISVDPNNDAARLTATYRITAPGGTWDAADMGTYTVTLQPNQVTDAGTNPVAAGSLGTFMVSGGGLVGVVAGGYWYCDVNANQRWDNSDAAAIVRFGSQGATPVVGDWNGDGQTEVGAYANGAWWLDTNGNQVSDSEDAVFYFGLPGNSFYGYPPPTPVVGDWNGDGKDEVGVYNGGVWFRDVNGNRTWDSADAASVTRFGWGGATPVVGDWNGDGKDDLGVYNLGAWFRDVNGNNRWDGADQTAIMYYGWDGPTPVVGDWNGDRKDEVGVYNLGAWFRDVNGNNRWDGADQAAVMYYGWAGAQPVVGNWSAPGTPLLAAPGQSTVSGNLPALTQAQLQPIVQEAVARWAALGVSPQVLKTMQKTPVIVADLPAAALGGLDHGTITIDRNAAGYGWFVDPTPNRDEEFAAVPAGGEFRAVDPRVVDRMDLLTVVEHELGHASGLRDLDPSALALMSGQLGTGMRRSAGKAEVDVVLAHAAAHRWL